jgi:hypothetical protein
MAFMAAWVPTGMKIGVSITPWGVVTVPRRAAVVLSFLFNLNFITFSWLVFACRHDGLLHPMNP